MRRSSAGTRLRLRTDKRRWTIARLECSLSYLPLASDLAASDFIPIAGKFLRKVAREFSEPNREAESRSSSAKRNQSYFVALFLSLSLSRLRNILGHQRSYECNVYSCAFIIIAYYLSANFGLEGDCFNVESSPCIVVPLAFL